MGSYEHNTFNTCIGYPTVAAEEVQRHYRAHHRYGCVHFAHDAGMTHDAGRRPITAALI